MGNKNSVMRGKFNYLTYYAKLPYWTKEECFVLACNLNPIAKNSPIPLAIAEKLGNEQWLINSLNRSIEFNEIRAPNNKIKPIDFINWCEEKDTFFPEKLKNLIKNHHTDFNNKVDLKNENNKQKEEINKLKEDIEKLTIELEQKFLHKTTEISYHKLLAMICAAFKLSKEQFNAYQIYTLASNCKLKFPLLSQGKIAKYLKTPRSLLDLSETQAKSKNTATK